MKILTELIGQTVIGVNVGRHALHLQLANGKKFGFWHERECCETVEIDQVDGDIDDLIGTPLVMAEVVSERYNGDDSLCVYTFYKFATVNGYVTVRWNGTSNGYYGVKVGMFEQAPTLDLTDIAYAVRLSTQTDGDILG